ncbi:MAG TPA: hypothetical protein DCE56_29585 [Cyanobacteria bacterium UBA8553]|nr:hypothetical protein [Cyanobacteria bacterium UBA8553]
MPRDPATGIYTPLNPRDPKKVQFVTLPILVGAGKSRTVSVRADIADYFNMTSATTAQSGGFVEKQKSRTARAVYASLLDTTPVDSQGTTTNKFLLPGRVGGKGKGKIIVVPTELRTPRGSIRTCRISFPSIANLAAISNFLAVNCKAHVPTYFITMSGVKRAVGLLPAGKDPNPDLNDPLGLLSS